MRDQADLLYELLDRRVPSAGRAWQARLDAILGRGSAPDTLGRGSAPHTPVVGFDAQGFLAAYTAAARWLGKAPLALDAGEREALLGAGVSWPVDGWPLDELGRVAMVSLASRRIAAEEVEALVTTCYRQGESRERRALLRALPLIAGGARFVPLAVEACRTNELPIFEAIACENPYPAEHFPDLNFNQLVLKAMFLGVALGRIIGLERRKSRELSRMAQDYASERRAAGRSIPADIGVLLLPDDGGSAQGRAG